MEELLGRLKQIHELLEQVEAITMNQMTVLLQPQETVEKENEALDLLDELVSYKEELTNQIQEQEAAFDEGYKRYKGEITNSKYIQLFKQEVARILELKTAIVEAEQNNVLIMQGRIKKQARALEIPKVPQSVAAAYKKQQSNT